MTKRGEYRDFMRKAIFYTFSVMFGLIGLKITATCSDISTNTVTIYLDESSQMTVRMAVMWYEYERQAAMGTENEKDYPKIDWNLVEKSYLSPEEQESELYAELEAGEGPDIILVDQESMTDPYWLLKSGWLLELDDFLEEDPWMQQLEFYSGVLKAGKTKEKQYLLPLSMQTPVLYAKEGALAESGYTEADVRTLDGLLRWAADYQETTGTRAFAEQSFWEDIFLHSGLELVDHETNETAIPYEELRQFCDACKEAWEAGLTAEKAGDFLQGYEKIQAEEALFAAAASEDLWRTLSNLKVLESDDGETVLLPFPTQDGEVQTVITHAAGVNRNSKSPEAAQVALRAMFSYRAVMQGQSGQGMSAVSNQDGLPVTFFAGGEHWGKRGNSVIQAGKNDFKAAYEEVAGRAVTSAIFETPVTGTGGILSETMMPYIRGEAEYDACIKKLEEMLDTYALGDVAAEKTKEPQTCITVVYDNEGLGEHHPYCNWWKEAVGELEKEGIHVSLVGEWDGTLYSFIGQMQDVGAAPDVLISRDGTLRVACRNDALSQYTELGAEIPRETYVPGALEAFTLDGLLYAAPFSVNVTGLWYQREVLEQVGVKRQGIETWEDLTELLRRIKNAFPECTPLMISNTGTVMQQILLQGGACSIQENGKIQLDEMWAVETIQWLQELGKEGLAACAPDHEIAGLFRDGACAVYFGDGDLLNHFELDGTVPWEGYREKTEFSEFPAADTEIGQSSLLMKGELFYLPEGDNTEAALRFVQACMEAEAYEPAVRGENRMPLKTELLEEEEVRAAAAMTFRRESYEDLDRAMNLALQGKSETEALYGICEKAFAR